MDTQQLSLERMLQFQKSWQLFIDRAANEVVPDCPRSPEDKLRADIKNEAIWLLNSMRQYRAIPLAERY